ncbi:MAG: glycosyltransferase [Verrucomicrobiota bacterium]
MIRDLGHGGAQRQMVTLAKGLAGQGAFAISVVHFYSGPFESELRAAGVETYCVGKKHRWDLVGFFFRLVRVMRRLKPDVIHGYLHESNLMAVFLKPLCGFPRAVWGIRDSQTDAATWGVLGILSFRLNCLLSGWADRIIGNSRAGRGYYMRQGYPAAQFEVVPNGIDDGRFRPQPKETFGSTFAMVGRLHPMKDHPTFLRALARLPEARGLIIGSGDATYTGHMQILARELGVADRVEWQPARDDLAQVYPTFDVLVSTSAYGEGFSNVLGEAMACAVPVIASDVGDSAWLVDDPRWVFHSGDDVELAEKMRAFLSLDSRERSWLGQKNHQRIQQNFTVSKMVETTGVICLSEALQRLSSQRAAEAFELLRAQGSWTRPKQASAVLDGTPAPQSSTQPQRVLWITTGLGTGGAEMMLTQIITGLPHHQHAVISLTSGGKYVEPLRAAGAQVYSLDMPTGRPTLRALGRLFRLAWQVKPAVIMGWMYHGCLAAVMVKIFRLGLGRVIWNIRQSLYDLGLEKRGSALVIRALSWLSFFAETITYNSRLSAKQHEETGYPASKTKLVPNGFDLEKWNKFATSTAFVPASSSMAVQETFRKDDTSAFPRIGRFGRFTDMKDYPTFLAAAALIAKDHPLAEFLLAGTGVDESNLELTALVERYTLQKQVRLLGERNDLPAITASLDVAVSSSSFGEGFPNVVGEAMACAVPVVATDIGDTSWVMGGAGRLVPAKDPQALAAACLEILALTDVERHQIGEKGCSRISEHFSLQSVLSEFDSMLTAL